MSRKPDWLQDLDADLGPGRRSQSHCRCQPKQTDKWGIALFVGVGLLAVLLVGAFLYRGGHLDRWVKPQRPYAPYSQRYQANPQAYMLERVEKRSRWNSEILTLISILNNHNLAVSQHGYPRSEYIYLNKDWTIDRLPNRVKLDPETRAFLQKYLRSNYRGPDYYRGY
jgi:hypothetical protein